MKKIFKPVSTIVCATMFFTSTAYLPTALAAENSAQTQTTVTDRVNAILNGTDNKVVVSKIPEGEAYIPKDTKIPMELTQTIDAKHGQTGETIKFNTTQNIIVNGVTVIPTGSLVYGTITKAKGPGMLGRAGTLEFTIDYVQTINGVKVPIAYNSSEHGNSDGGAVAVFAVVSIVGGLFMKGSNVVVKQGTKFEVPVAQDTDLNVPLDKLADAMNPNMPHGVEVTIK
ncbi:hypothetical protein [Pectinatus frisingensis]|uniref:hypothetical protein n=1 Tax=Pectinatus frisingensis TaxID=865 RepID=UPI003D807614